MTENILPALDVNSEFELFDTIIDDVAAKGYAVIDDFLSIAQVQQIMKTIEKRKEGEAFKKAGIGNLYNFTVQSAIRGDYISWLEETDEPDSVNEYIKKMKSLMDYFNRTCFLSLKDIELHFAIYPATTFYARHRDRFKEQSHRQISCVCYLNENWIAEDGGQLVIYLPDGSQQIVIPKAGTFVCFKSELEHEVLVAHKNRYSITGWMLDKPVELRFL